MWGKTFVTSVEGEFKTDKLRNNHVFHDINLRVKDPEEFRMTSVEYLRGLGYNVSINELTEFEDTGEIASLFQGGRLKPLKNVIKASKVTERGSRFPLIWRLLLLVGIISIIGYFLPYEQLNKPFLFYLSIISLIFSGIFYLIKKVVLSSIWVKIIGVYDVEGVKADVRTIISADASELDSKVFDNLRNEVTELFDLLSRKYLRKEEEAAIMKPVSKSKTEEVITKMMTVNKNIEALRDKFINGHVSEDVFKNLNKSLEDEKDKLETILDLVSL